MVDMRILSDPYEEECFLILKSNLPKMKDEDALELYIKLKKSFKKREFDSCLQFFTNQIAQNVDYINAFEFFYCQIRENKCTNMG